MKDVKKYHGYLALPRHSRLLIDELGYDLFGFYISLIMLAVWYRGNNNFCKITITQAQIARELNISQSTISRRFKELEKYRYYLIRRDGYMILGYLPLFLSDVATKIHSKDYANVDELYADMHKLNAELQEKYVISQDKRGQNAPQSLSSSSKNNSSLFDDGIEDKDIERSIEEAGRETE